MADTAEHPPKADTGNARRRGRAQSEHLEDQVEKLQDDLRAITKTLQRMGETQVSSVRNKAQHEVDHLLKAGQHAVEGAQDEFSHVERQLKDSIRERPLTAVAGAVALGFLVAVLTR